MRTPGWLAFTLAILGRIGGSEAKADSCETVVLNDPQL